MTRKRQDQPPSNAAAPITRLHEMQRLLRMEYAYEREEFQRQTEAMGIARKVKRGLCWYPTTAGRNYYNSLNQLVLEITRQTDTEVEHNFEYGRPVYFFRLNEGRLNERRPNGERSNEERSNEERLNEGGDIRQNENNAGSKGKADGKKKAGSKGSAGNITYFNFQGIVSYADDSRMVVVVPGMSAVLSLQGATDLGVQLALDETSYRTMLEALDDTIRAKGNRLAELRDILGGQGDATKPGWRQLYPVSLPWLNPSQEAAVNRVLAARDVAIVHGPPGTGKTTTLVETIYESLHREPQVLVCAQSNTAVDWIAEKLTDRGLSVLRIGNPSRVNDKMLSSTYERRFENHPSYPELWSLRRELRALRGRGRRGSYTERESLRSRISRLRDRATALEVQINDDLFRAAHVVASTLVSSGHRLLNGHRFGTLFIDEAAQALEPACWIAIRRADRVVLAGDHQQLPPTVKCYEAARQGLDHTLMEHIVATRPEAVTRLRVQYRMNEAIMHFSSGWFYQGQLEAAPQVRHRSILDLDTPITWVDTTGRDFKEEFVGESFGRINREEARLLLDHLQAYINRIGGERILDERIDFGIISPYRAQVQYLRDCIRSSDALRPYRQLLTVHTVDGFQGQERDVIFISLVRANEDGQIGFLRDLRRMNVAMTRARMKLVIFGEAETLGHHPFYRKLLDYINQTAQD